MGHHIGRDLFAAEPLFAANFFKDGNQPLGVVASTLNVLQPQLIGLGFIFPAVGQGRGLASSCRPKGKGLSGCAITGCGADEDACHHTCHGGEVDPLGTFDSLGDVAAYHVSYFMTQYTGQFIFTLHRRQQTAVNEDVTGGNGEGVVGVLFDDVEVILERLLRHAGQYFLPHSVHIARNGRVIDQFMVAGNVFHELPGKLVLLLQRDRPGWGAEQGYEERAKHEHQANGKSVFFHMINHWA